MLDRALINSHVAHRHRMPPPYRAQELSGVRLIRPSVISPARSIRRFFGQVEFTLKHHCARRSVLTINGSGTIDSKQISVTTLSSISGIGTDRSLRGLLHDRIDVRILLFSGLSNETTIALRGDLL